MGPCLTIKFLVLQSQECKIKNNYKLTYNGNFISQKKVDVRRQQDL